MKKKVSLPILSFLALGTLSFLPSCSASAEIAGIHMSNPETMNVYYGNFSYEGINVTVDFRDGSYKEIPLAEEMISEVERLKFFKIGSQEIEVVYRSRYKTTMPVEVVLNEFKDSYALNGYECVYDGQPHTVTLNQELPEGATITYPYGNIFTNAGSYEVVGVLAKNGYASKTLSTTLTILQAERDASGIVFEDATYIYNGEMRTIEATNIPEGVEVSYEILDYEHDFRLNKAVNAGKYRIVAHFVDASPNYQKIPDRTAILTIEKARYDVSTIKLIDVIKEYDGLNYEAKILNEQDLPTGIHVTYSYLNEQGNPVTNNAQVGTYTMVADFLGEALDNYYPIDPLTATLKVTKRVIKIADKISFESKTVSFDENEVHSLAITGTLPDTVEVTYENNGKTYAGEYEVIAHFAAKNENETVDISELSAYLIINSVRRSVKVYNEETQKYDKEFSANNIQVKDGVLSVTGYDETVFVMTSAVFYRLLDNQIVSPTDFVDGETYKYAINFQYIDENMNQSVVLSAETDSFIYHEA